MVVIHYSNHFSCLDLAEIITVDGIGLISAITFKMQYCFWFTILAQAEGSFRDFHLVIPSYDSHNRSGHQDNDSVKLKITSILRMLPVGLGKWPHSRCLDPPNQCGVLLDQNSTDLISVWSTLTGGHDNVSGPGYQCQFRCCIQKKEYCIPFFTVWNDSATVGSFEGRSGK